MTQSTFKDVSKEQFNAFVLQHRLTRVYNFHCQDLQWDYVTPHNEVVATHECIGCGNIHQIINTVSSQH